MPTDTSRKSPPDKCIADGRDSPTSLSPLSGLLFHYTSLSSSITGPGKVNIPFLILKKTLFPFVNVNAAFSSDRVPAPSFCNLQAKQMQKTQQSSWMKYGTCNLNWEEPENDFQPGNTVDQVCLLHTYSYVYNLVLLASLILFLILFFWLYA